MKLFAGCREHIKAVSFFCLIFFLFNVLLSTEINFDMLAKKTGVGSVLHFTNLFIL